MHDTHIKQSKYNVGYKLKGERQYNGILAKPRQPFNGYSP